MSIGQPSSNFLRLVMLNNNNAGDNRKLIIIIFITIIAGVMKTAFANIL